MDPGPHRPLPHAFGRAEKAGLRGKASEPQKDPGLHRPLPHAYGRKERAGLRGASSPGSEDTESRLGNGLDTPGDTTARIKDLKVIGHVNAIAVAAQMVYTMTELVGSVPKPQSKARTQYPEFPEAIPDVKCFTRKPLQEYDSSAESALNNALSELKYKILPNSTTTKGRAGGLNVQVVSSDTALVPGEGANRQEWSEETVIALYAMAAIDRALDEVHMAKWDALNRPHCSIHNMQDDTPEGDQSASIQGALSTVGSESSNDWSMDEDSLLP